MEFEIIEQPDNTEIITNRIDPQILLLFRKKFGVKYKIQLPFVYRKFRWQKLKAVVRVKLSDGEIRLAEIHWFKSRGIGEIYPRIKRFLD